MRKRVAGFVAIAVALWFVFGGINARVTEAPRGPEQNTQQSGAQSQGNVQHDGNGAVRNAPTASRSTSSQIGFRSRARLEEHYAKHGREFGRLTIEDYLAKAQQLRDASPGGDVLEIIRKTDGVISRFDRSTGAFLAVDSDGTIRTFFKPNDGESYFRRQANRSATP